MITDVTDVALEWADRNVKNNPHISGLIEIRKVDVEVNTLERGESHIDQSVDGENCINPSEIGPVGLDPSTSSSLELNFGGNRSYQGPPILLGVVKDGEIFDFCMCNPPFFETMEEAGLNPNTSCGGTPMEMVCPGGEQAFISRIIEDSAQLKQSFRYCLSLLVCFNLSDTSS